MKLYVTVEEFLYAKKIENQTERTLRGYKNALNLFANWLQKEWTIDELEKIRVVHLKQYVAYHLKMGHKATYVNGIIKILRAFFKYTNNHLRSPQVGTERIYSTWQITDILARVQRVTPTIRRPSRAHFPAPAVVEAITVQCIPAHRHEWTRQKIIMQSHRTAQIRTM